MLLVAGGTFFNGFGEDSSASAGMADIRDEMNCRVLDPELGAPVPEAREASMALAAVPLLLIGFVQLGLDELENANTLQLRLQPHHAFHARAFAWRRTCALPVLGSSFGGSERLRSALDFTRCAYRCRWLVSGELCTRHWRHWRRGDRGDDADIG